MAVAQQIREMNRKAIEATGGGRRLILREIGDKGSARDEAGGEELHNLTRQRGDGECEGSWPIVSSESSKNRVIAKAHAIRISGRSITVRKRMKKGGRQSR